MKNTMKLIAVTLMLTFATSSAMAEVNIIPQPLEVKEAKGAPFVLTAKTPITYSCDGAKASADMLAAYLKPATGFCLSATKAAPPAANGIHLQIDSKRADLGDEGYTLTATKDGVLISAPKPAGLFYGIQTLRQLLPAEIFKSETVSNVKWTVPAVAIKDKPRFVWRSYMLDVARNFHGKEVVKKHLEWMAQHKMNRFHWHLTDDQGWRIEIKKYPKLTSVGAKRKNTQIGGWKTQKYTGKPQEGFYTQEQVKEIVQFAKDRHIMVIPEIGMPGHATAALASYPEFRCKEQVVPEVAFSFGKKPYVYDISNPKLYTFISDIIDEVAALFPGTTIHIGGDEVSHGHWMKSASIKALMEKEKITNYSDVQVYFTNRVVDMIQGKGRRVMGWNEITGDLVHGSTKHKAERKLSKTAVVQFWKGSADLLRSAIEAGYDCVNSTHSSTYLDYTYGKISVQKAYDFDPIPRGLKEEHQAKVVGFGCQMWGEFTLVEARMEYRMFPRLCAYAEIGWTSLENKDFARFRKTLETTHYKRLGLQGIRYAKNVFVNEVHDPAEFKDWAKIGEWTKKMMDSEYIFTWDASKVVSGNGKYEVALVFTEGKHNLAPLFMELLQDGKVVSRDNHPAYAGKTLRNNVYRFDVKTYNPKAKYTVRMENCKSGGWKTLGDVKMTKKE